MVLYRIIDNISVTGSGIFSFIQTGISFTRIVAIMEEKYPTIKTIMPHMQFGSTSFELIKCRRPEVA
ncbi:MAG TPA: hypothetical protein GXX58_07755, partial [Gelria sp.]|nr:hypothetical protein [Gelria sp.]